MDAVQDNLSLGWIFWWKRRNPNSLHAVDLDQRDEVDAPLALDDHLDLLDEQMPVGDPDDLSDAPEGTTVVFFGED